MTDIFKEVILPTLEIMINAWTVLILVVLIVFRKGLKDLLGSREFELGYKDYKIKFRKIEQINALLDQPQTIEKIASLQEDTREKVKILKAELGKTLGIRGVKTFMNYFADHDNAVIALSPRDQNELEILKDLDLIKEESRFRLDSPLRVCVRYVITNLGLFFRSIVN